MSVKLSHPNLQDMMLTFGQHIISGRLPTRAERGVRKLLGENIISQVNDNKRDKVYCATEILPILEEPAKIHADVEED